MYICDEINSFSFVVWGSPGGSDSNNLPAMLETQVRSLGLEDPLEEEMQTTLVFFPGESQGQRRLVGYSPGGHTESDMTKLLTLCCFKSWILLGLPWWLRGEESACQCRRHGLLNIDP